MSKNNRKMCKSTMAGRNLHFFVRYNMLSPIDLKQAYPTYGLEFFLRMAFSAVYELFSQWDES